MLQKVELAIHSIADLPTIQCVLLMMHVLVKDQDAADGKFAKRIENYSLKQECTSVCFCFFNAHFCIDAYFF